MGAQHGGCRTIFLPLLYLERGTLGRPDFHLSYAPFQPPALDSFWRRALYEHYDEGSKSTGCDGPFKNFPSTTILLLHINGTVPVH